MTPPTYGDACVAREEEEEGVHDNIPGDGHNYYDKV